MTKVISMNLFRLRKDKTFYAVLLFMAAMGVFFPVGRYMVMKEEGYINTLETAFFVCTVFIGFAAAVFCGLFLGTEYSDGTIRNKLIAGQKRSGVYLAAFLTCGTAVLIMYAAFFIPCLCAGIPLLGFFESPLKLILLYTLAALFLGLAFAALFTMIAMLWKSRAASSIACILLALLLLVSGVYIAQRLDAPPVISAYSITDSGETVSEQVENPRYLKGTERKVYAFLFDFLPGGQVLQCTTQQSEHPQRLPLYSGIIMIASTAAGMLLFRKKDIN